MEFIDSFNRGGTLISKLTGDKIATIQEHYRTPSVDEMRQLTQKKAFV